MTHIFNFSLKSMVKSHVFSWQERQWAEVHEKVLKRLGTMQWLGQIGWNFDVFVIPAYPTQQLVSTQLGIFSCTSGRDWPGDTAVLVAGRLLAGTLEVTALVPDLVLVVVLAVVLTERCSQSKTGCKVCTFHSVPDQQTMQKASYHKLENYDILFLACWPVLLVTTVKSVLATTSR